MTLPVEPYRVICADPPWQFGDRLPGPKRGAEKHYRCLTVEEIAAFPLPPLADDAALFLWRVSSMQLEALAVIQEWGFNMPTSEIIWIKTTKDGRIRMGMGRTVRNAHEVCLICRRGKPERKDAGVLSVVEAPERACSVCKEPQFELPFGGIVTCVNGHEGAPSVEMTLDDHLVFAERSRHSAKPDESYSAIERLYAGPRVELFARRNREGWTCHGNELPEQGVGT